MVERKDGAAESMTNNDEKQYPVDRAVRVGVDLHKEIANLLISQVFAEHGAALFLELGTEPHAKTRDRTLNEMATDEKR